MPKRPNQKPLALLAYSDSEHEDDDQHDDSEVNSEDLDNEIQQDNDDQLKNTTEGDNIEQSSNVDDLKETKIYFEDVYGDRDLSIIEFHESLFGKTDVEIPPETRNECPEELQKQIESLYEKINNSNNSYNLIHIIQKRKSMNNPSIYEKMITYCQLDEMATNYPKDIYDPQPFLNAESYYEELSKKQKEEMEKREREWQKQKSLSSSTAAAAPIESNNKKSKWDSNNPTTTTTNAAAMAAALAAASKVKHLSNQSNNVKSNHNHQKPTVISAFGTINKKK